MGAVPFGGGEVAAAGEAGDVADVGQDPGGSRGPDPVDARQVRPGRQDRGLELGFHGLQLDVQALDVLQFLRGHPPAGLPGQVTGPDGGQQGLVLAGGGGLLHRRPAGQEPQEQAVQPVQGLRPGAGELIAAAAASAAPSAQDRR